MNIIISGWPSAGTTSLALILANYLEYTYLYGGGVLKYLSRRIYGDDSGEVFIKFEQTYGRQWDDIWEAYALWKAKNTDKLLLEGKTAGFLIHGDNFYKIMLTADSQTRGSRASNDGRTDAVATIIARDKLVRQRWIDMFNVDIYDHELIDKNYNLEIDNSKLSIKDEVLKILGILKNDTRFKEYDWQSFIDRIDSIIDGYNKSGKKSLLKMLEEKDLVIDPDKVLKEWKKHLPEKFNALPPEIKNLASTKESEPVLQ